MAHAADVHVAERLGRLGGESNDDVRLAVALTVRGVRSGSVCVDLDLLRHQWTALEPALPWPDPAAWSAAVRDSPLVGDGKPLRLELGLLYLDRGDSSILNALRNAGYDTQQQPGSPSRSPNRRFSIASDTESALEGKLKSEMRAQQGVQHWVMPSDVNGLKFASPRASPQRTFSLNTGSGARLARS